MIRFANIKVTSPSGSVLIDNVYRLPITIGRHSNATISIPDAPPDMSRVHVRLSESHEGVLLVDESTLGTEYQGETINRQTRLLKQEDQFSFRDYTVTVRAQVQSQEDVDSIKVYLRTAGGLPIKKKDGSPFPPIKIGDFHLICLVDRDDKVKFESVPVGAVKGNLLGSYNLSDMEMVFLIGRISNDEFAFVASDHASRFNVMLNRSSVESGKETRIRAFDLIEIGEMRLELVDMEGNALRCSNPACERLNKYDPTANCKWCGHRLVLAQTQIYSKSG